MQRTEDVPTPIGQAIPCWTRLAIAMIGGLFSAGCVQAFPEAGGPTPEPDREVVESKPGATVYREAGVEGALWLELDRAEADGGPIGGYVTQPEGGRGAMVLLLQGANPGWEDRRLPHTLQTHQSLGQAFIDAGFATWTPYLVECGTPYGQEDLAEVLVLIDWLQDGGLDSFSLQRLYVVGYSKGATLATLANLQRPAGAYVSLNGLTQPDQFENGWAFYQFVVTVYPANEGFCQLKNTLDAYGPTGSPGWDVLDAVSRIGSLHSPELFVHDLGDPIYNATNTLAMEARYQTGLAGGELLAPLTFIYLEGSNHFLVRTEPAIHLQVVDYLMQFEPAAE